MVAPGAAWPDSTTLPCVSYSAVSIDSAFGFPGAALFGSCSTRAPRPPSCGSTTASAVSPARSAGAAGLIDNATVSSDLTVALLPGLEASAESRRLPEPIGCSGISTHSPRRSAVTSPIALSPSRTITFAPGSARPAMTAVPVGPTLTTSKLGGTVGCATRSASAGLASASAGSLSGAAASLEFGASLFCLPSPRKTTAPPATSRRTAVADPIKTPYRTDPREIRQIATWQLYALTERVAIFRSLGGRLVGDEENRTGVRLLRFVGRGQGPLSGGGKRARGSAGSGGDRAGLWWRSGRVDGAARRRGAKRRWASNRRHPEASTRRRSGPSRRYRAHRRRQHARPQTVDG